MLNDDKLAVLSVDELWELHVAIEKALVVRLTARSREMDGFLEKILPGSNQLAGVRQRKAALQSA
jgi:hypothetical protein